VFLLTAMGTAETSTIESAARFGFDALNPVSVGYTGLYCLIAIFFLWFDTRPLVRFFVLLPLALASMYIMLIANARGAVVGFALCVAALSIRRGTVLIAVGFLAVLLGFLFGDTIENSASSSAWRKPAPICHLSRESIASKAQSSSW
jgi:hypothetical protein